MTTHTQPKPNGTPTWIDLVTTDLDAARTFYQAVFGWEYDIGGPEYGGYTTARIGDRSVAGLGGQMPDSPPQPATWNVYFASDAIETHANNAVEHGAQITYPVMNLAPFGSMVSLADPTGAAFQFWQAEQHIGAQMTDEPGAGAWYELYTPDAKAARDFYTATLGASAELMPGGLEYYVLKHGDAQLAGVMQIDPAWGEILRLTILMKR
jgi:uncharacterized protein